jgi:hypothetical protein
MHRFQLDVTGLKQGNYLYCLEACEQKMVRQMMVVR